MYVLQLSVVTHCWYKSKCISDNVVVFMLHSFAAECKYSQAFHALRNIGYFHTHQIPRHFILIDHFIIHVINNNSGKRTGHFFKLCFVDFLCQTSGKCITYECKIWTSAEISMKHNNYMRIDSSRWFMSIHDVTNLRVCIPLEPPESFSCMLYYCVRRYM